MVMNPMGSESENIGPWTPHKNIIGHQSSVGFVSQLCEVNGCNYRVVKGWGVQGEGVP